MACAPALRETRPPEKVPYRGKIGPYLVKKEFDEEGKSTAIEFHLSILNDQHWWSVPTVRVTFTDGSTRKHEFYYSINNSMRFQSIEGYPVGKSIEKIEIFTDPHARNPFRVVENFGGSPYDLQGDMVLEVRMIEHAVDLANQMGVDLISISETPVEEKDGVDERMVGGIQAYHHGARMYDPVIAVWLSTDPMDEFWNAYSYVGGNPLMYTDPTGMKKDLYTNEDRERDVKKQAHGESGEEPDLVPAADKAKRALAEDLAEKTGMNFADIWDMLGEESGGASYKELERALGLDPTKSSSGSLISRFILSYKEIQEMENSAGYSDFWKVNGGSGFGLSSWDYQLDMPCDRTCREIREMAENSGISHMLVSMGNNEYVYKPNFGSGWVNSYDKIEIAAYIFKDGKWRDLTIQDVIGTLPTPSVSKDPVIQEAVDTFIKKVLDKKAKKNNRKE